MYFSDRSDAGKQLAEKLLKFEGKDIVIYGLPRGGVVTAYEIAHKLHAPLDLIITRKIGHPHEREYAIAALSENGKIVINPAVLQSVDHEWLENEIQTQQQEIQRRRSVYLKNRAPLPIKGKIAILVDDGVATGLTIEAAIKDVKSRHPRKIVVATPVIPLDVAKTLEKEGTTVIALERTRHFIGGIGAYYKAFPQIADREVLSLIDKLNRNTYVSLKC